MKTNGNDESLNDDKTPGMPRHSKEREARKKIARTVKKKLTLLIGSLIAILLVLLFQAGEVWWPVWVVAHQTQIEGIILFSIIVLFLSSPIIIEANSNPQALDGPGKNPYL